MLLSTLALVSCKSVVIYDNTVPDNQLAELYVPNYYTVTSFDGKQVKWKGPAIETFREYTVVKVPAGRHTIEYEYKRTDTSGGNVSHVGGTTMVNGQRAIINQTTISPSTSVTNRWNDARTIDFKAGKSYSMDGTQIRGQQTEKPGRGELQLIQ